MIRFVFFFGPPERIFNEKGCRIPVFAKTYCDSQVFI